MNDLSPAKSGAPLELIGVSTRWKVLLVDENEETHSVVYGQLKPFVHQGRGIELMSATNAQIAELLIEQNPDLAVILLGKPPAAADIAQLIRFVRQQLHNGWTRILNCTGAPKDFNDEVMLKSLQGFMSYPVLKEAKLRSYLQNALKSFEGVLYSQTGRQEGAKLPERAGVGAVTIFRWRNQAHWPVEFVSLNVKELIGYSDEELTSGQVVYDQLVFPGDLERVASEVQDYSARGLNSFTQEYRLLTRDGRVIWIYDFTNVIRDAQGNITHYLGYITDITDKKEQDRLLFEREIFGLVRIDEEETVTEVNQTAADILRVAPALAQGTPISDWIDTDNQARVNEAFASIRKEGQPQRFEANIKTWDGGLTTCQFTLSPHLGAGGAQGTILLLEDLTEKKKVEDELRRALAAEKSFIASVSHEIRTPLSSILGYTELLLSSAGLKEEQKRFSENIAVNSQHLLNLINDILDISKLESNQLGLNVQEVVFSDIFTACGVVVSSRIKEGVRLNVNVPDFNYYVKCDPIRIKQIFINLLSNAAKFTDHGSINLYIKDFTPLQGDLLSLRICVEDSGIGISKDKQSQLFQPFKQAHIGEYGGTGLGLYLSRSIAKLMEGDITIESELGKGSRFIVELVLAKGRLKDADFNFQNRKLLVVGDYPSLSETQKSKLLETGAELVFIDGQEQGKPLFGEILEQKNLETVILDLDVLKDRALYLAGVIKECHPQVGLVGLKTKSNQIQLDLLEQTLLKPFSYFQLAKAVKKSLAHLSQSKTEDFSQLRVLMVEDVAANRQLYAQMFKKFFRLELETASRGKEAIQLLKKGGYDLVLMDLQMPEMDGIETTREIRKFDLKTPIIAMTGSVYTEDVNRAKAAGMNAYLSKPVQKDDLHKLLQDLLGERPEQPAPAIRSNAAAGEEPALKLERTEAQLADANNPLTAKMKDFLETIGSPDEVQEEILTTAVREIIESYAGIKQGLAQGDKKLQLKELHKLKGLLSNINLGDQGEMANDLELLIKQNGDEAVIQKKMDNFFKELREFDEA